MEMTLEQWRKKFIEYLEGNWTTDDGAHDMHHLHRVWRRCLELNAREGSKADELVLLAACYFHDFVTVRKDDPARGQASRLSADAAVALLRNSFSYPEEKLDAVHHAIHAHSF